MSKRQRYTHNELVKRLKKAGFKVTRRANHGVCMTREGLARPVTVPLFKGETLPIGLSRDILKQAGIEDED